MTAPVPVFDADAHRYTYDGRNYPSVTQIIEGLGLTPKYAPDRGQKAFGTALHKAAELAICDRLDYTKTAPVLMPYIEGLMEKSREMRIRPIATEIRGVHLGEGFAGTMDMLCTILDSDLAIIDYKSGSSVPRCTELQTAGYAELALFMESYKNGCALFTRDKMPRRFSMQLLPGRAVVRECVDTYDYPAFIAAVRLFKWTRERRKYA